MKIGMLGKPKKAIINAVSSEGETPLNAFDNCLLKLGIGDVSLVKLTSILPEDIEFIDKTPQLCPGSNVPAIYTYITSEKTGQKIAAAIVAAKTKNGPVLVAEYSNTDISASEAKKEAIKRVVEMAKNRKREIEGEIIVKSTEHIVKKCGCALAIIVEVK
ncbi:MAG: arginine decarboxylase, pyruvoyl-dependent [Candidatus Odinarchaeota archaeon]|nr:arginine decarboxylase, pyruvoyl-dependent [Candidatus Odinarchaeota archaeon]